MHLCIDLPASQNTGHNTNASTYASKPAGINLTQLAAAANIAELVTRHQYDV
jgi:hypothetical protein